MTILDERKVLGPAPEQSAPDGVITRETVLDAIQADTGQTRAVAERHLLFWQTVAGRTSRVYHLTDADLTEVHDTGLGLYAPDDQRSTPGSTLWMIEQHLTGGTAQLIHSNTSTPPRRKNCCVLGIREPV